MEHAGCWTDIDNRENSAVGFAAGSHSLVAVEHRESETVSFEAGTYGIDQRTDIQGREQWAIGLTHNSNRRLTAIQQSKQQAVCLKSLCAWSGRRNRISN